MSVSLEDAIADQLRVTAARQRTSVSEFAAGLISEALGPEREQKRAEAQASLDAVVAAAPVYEQIARNTEAARKARGESGSCLAYAPRGTKCKTCGKVHP